MSNYTYKVLQQTIYVHILPTKAVTSFGAGSSLTHLCFPQGPVHSGYSINIIYMSHLEEEVLVTKKEAHYSRNRLDPEVLLTCPFIL